MLESEPVLTVLVYTTAAAAFSAVGVLPFLTRGAIPSAWPGLAYALASGFMLGVGYIIMVEGLREAAVSVVLGGALGVGYTYLTHLYSRSLDIETLPEAAVGVEHGYKLVLQSALHSASEGVAIGVAMVLDLRLGAFTALALALHNAAEALGLASTLRVRGVSFGDTTGMSVITKAPQILMAIVAYSLVSALPGLLPWALGFAAGTLVLLAMTELLPASYQRAERTTIALLVSLSAGAVVLLRELVV